MKNKLFVFVGKPGVGKTTLINKVFSSAKLIDVMPYVKAYEVDGKVPEEKTLDGYRDMYDVIDNLDDEIVILELGTNHEKFNIKKLERLLSKFEISIFICNASIDTCRNRVKNRKREFDNQALEKRLQKNFPNIYLRALKNSKLKYEVLDMERDVEENKELIKNIWSK